MPKIGSSSLGFNLHYTRFIGAIPVCRNRLSTFGTIVVYLTIVALTLDVVLEWQQDGLYGASTFVSRVGLRAGQP